MNLLDLVGMLADARDLLTLVRGELNKGPILGLPEEGRAQLKAKVTSAWDQLEFTPPSTKPPNIFGGGYKA